MKRLTLTAVAATLAFAFPAFADDAHHPDTATANRVAAEPADDNVAKVQITLKKMLSQLERFTKATTWEERLLVLHEHHQSMHEVIMTGKAMIMGDGNACPMVKDDMMDKGG